MIFLGCEWQFALNTTEFEEEDPDWIEVNPLMVEEKDVPPYETENPFHIIPVREMHISYLHLSLHVETPYEAELR